MNIIRNVCVQVLTLDNPTESVLVPQIRRIIRS